MLEIKSASEEKLKIAQTSLWNPNFEVYSIPQ